MNPSQNAFTELSNVSFLSTILQKPYPLPLDNIRLVVHLNTDIRHFSMKDTINAVSISGCVRNEKIFQAILHLGKEATVEAISKISGIKAYTISKALATLRESRLVSPISRNADGSYKRAYAWRLTPRGLELANSYLEPRL